MQEFVPAVHSRSRLFKGLSAAILGLPLLLGGCSSIPDWADPTEWFDDDGPTRQTADASGGTDATPGIGSVPDGTREISSAEARAADVEALRADQSAARYSEDELAAQPVATGPVPKPDSAGVPSTVLGTHTTTVAALPAAPSATFSLAAPRAATFAPPRTVRHEVAAVIYFAHSSTSLDQNDLAVLAGVASLQRQRGSGVKIVGHASSRTAVASATEHRIANFNVSLARADSVRRALMQFGVPPSIVTTEAVGNAQPVYHEFMPTGEAGNRRVEVYLVY